MTDKEFIAGVWEHADKLTALEQETAMAKRVSRILKCREIAAACLSASGVFLLVLIFTFLNNVILNSGFVSVLIILCILTAAYHFETRQANENNLSEVS